MPPEQSGKGRTEWIRQFALALDLPFVLIASMMGGGFIGYLLDQWLHTGPWLMLILGGLGFAGGLRNVLQSLAQRGKNQAGNGSPRGPESGR